MKFSTSTTALTLLAATLLHQQQVNGYAVLSETKCENVNDPYSHQVCAYYEHYGPSPALVDGEMIYLGGYDYMFYYQEPLYQDVDVKVSWKQYEHDGTVSDRKNKRRSKRCKAYVNGQQCDKCVRCNPYDPLEPVTVDCRNTLADVDYAVGLKQTCQPLTEGVFLPFEVQYIPIEPID